MLSENGALVGVVSLSGVARHRNEASEEAPPAFYQHGTAHLQVPPDTLDDLAATSETTVRDIMMPTLFCVEEDAPAEEIADKMMRSGLHRFTRGAQRQPPRGGGHHHGAGHAPSHP